VAFLKFSRDKRGYENYYLFEPPSSGRHHGKGRPRLLFWFRTPPQVKVGRPPFSDEVRAMVEAQNPGVSFDWPRIIATPIPSPDVDHWRERRRVEKAAKRAAREAEVAEVEAVEAEAPPGAVAATTDAAAPDTTPADNGDSAGEAQGDAQAEAPVAASEMQGNPSPGHRRRRRRRRGGRGRPGPEGPQGPQSPPETPPTNEV